MPVPNVWGRAYHSDAIRHPVEATGAMPNIPLKSRPALEELLLARPLQRQQRLRQYAMAYPMDQVREAINALLSRRTTGKLISPSGASELLRYNLSPIDSVYAIQPGSSMLQVGAG